MWSPWQPGFVVLELVSQCVELLGGVWSTEVYDVEEWSAALDVTQEGEAETAVEMGVLDDSWDVCNYNTKQKIIKLSKGNTDLRAAVTLTLIP